MTSHKIWTKTTAGHYIIFNKALSYGHPVVSYDPGHPRGLSYTSGAHFTVDDDAAGVFYNDNGDENGENDVGGNDSM